jgi:predicted DNA-binding ribbon-helix-helix protein
MEAVASLHASLSYPGDAAPSQAFAHTGSARIGQVNPIYRRRYIWSDGTRQLARLAMTPSVPKRSIVVDGRKTSVSLEEQFWSILKEICAQRGLTVSELVSAIDNDRPHGNLSSAIRLFVLDHVRNRAVKPTEESKPPDSAPDLAELAD